MLVFVLTGFYKLTEVEILLLAEIEAKFEGSHEHPSIPSLKLNIVSNLSLFYLTSCSWYLIMPYMEEVVVPRIFSLCGWALVDGLHLIEPELFLFARRSLQGRRNLAPCINIGGALQGRGYMKARHTRTEPMDVFQVLFGYMPGRALQ